MLSTYFSTSLQVFEKYKTRNSANHSDINICWTHRIALRVRCRSWRSLPSWSWASVASAGRPANAVQTLQGRAAAVSSHARCASSVGNHVPWMRPREVARETWRRFATQRSAARSWVACATVQRRAHQYGSSTCSARAAAEQREAWVDPREQRADVERGDGTGTGSRAQG